MTKAATLQQALTRFLDPTGLDRQRQRVCTHLLACRTEAMGGMILQCSDCAYVQPRYFGCRDRHCPQCQGRARVILPSNSGHSFKRSFGLQTPLG